MGALNAGDVAALFARFCRSIGFGDGAEVIEDLGRLRDRDTGDRGRGPRDDFRFGAVVVGA